MRALRRLRPVPLRHVLNCATLSGLLLSLALATAVAAWLHRENIGHKWTRRGGYTVPVAVGPPCWGTSLSSADRTALALAEVEESRSRRAVVLTEDIASDNATLSRAGGLLARGAVDLAWRVPDNPTPNHLLQAALDHHTAAAPLRRRDQQHHNHPRYAVAVSSTHLHIMDTSQLPEVSLSLPMVCHATPKGVSAWQGVGSAAEANLQSLYPSPAQYSVMSRRGVEVVSVEEMMGLSLRGRRDSLRGTPLPVSMQEGRLRGAAITEAAMQLLQAAEIVAAAFPGEGAAQHARWAASLQSLRKSMPGGGTEDSTLEALSALLPGVPGEGAGAGALPFAFRTPAPGAAMQYPTALPRAYTSLHSLPTSLNLTVFNPGGSGAPSRLPFYFSVRTAEAVVLGVSTPDGVCEVLLQSGGDPAEGGGSEGESSGEQGEGAQPQRKHDVVCLVSPVEPLGVRRVEVGFRGVGEGAMAGTATSADSTFPQISNFCGTVSYLGDRRFSISVRPGPGNATETSVVQFTPLSVLGDDALPQRRRRRHRRTSAAPGSKGHPIDPPGVLRGFAEVAAACFALSLFSTGNRAHRSLRLQSRNVAAALLGLLLLCLAPFPVSEGDVLSAYLPPLTAATALLGVERAYASLAFSLLKVVPLWLVGPHFSNPAWVGTPVPSGYTVEVSPGRVADELTLLYEDLDLTTTLTLWHGKTCRVDVEHWLGGGGGSAPLDIRMTVEGAGGSHVHTTDGRFRYRPHMPRRDNSIPVSGGVRIGGRPVLVGSRGKQLGLSFRPAIVASVLPEYNNLHFDIRLAPEEGFLCGIHSGAVPGGDPGQPEEPSHLLVLEPAEGFEAEFASLNPSHLRPPDGIVLERVREVGGEGGGGGGGLPPGSLLLTYRSLLRDRVLVGLEGLCRLPRCKGMALHPADHLGAPLCGGVPKVSGQHPVLPDRYSSFIAAHAQSLC